MGLFGGDSSTTQTTNVHDRSVRTNLYGDVRSGGHSFIGVQGGTYNLLDNGAIGQAFDFSRQALLMGASAIDQSHALSNSLITRTTGDQGAAKNTGLIIVAVGLAIAMISYTGK